VHACDILHFDAGICVRHSLAEDSQENRQSLRGAMVEATDGVMSKEESREQRWRRYDTNKSPFLELQTPFTTGCGTHRLLNLLLLAPACMPKLARTPLVAGCNVDWHALYCREAVKMVIMAPVAILRCLIALLLLVVVAGLSFTAAYGW
jgi:hypothetical protein